MILTPGGLSWATGGPSSHACVASRHPARGPVDRLKRKGPDHPEAHTAARPDGYPSDRARSLTGRSQPPMAGTVRQTRSGHVTTQTSTIPTIDDARIAEILALLPAEVRTEARLRLAAVAAAATEEEQKRIRAEIVDTTLTAAREGNWCGAAEQALTLTFGEPEGGTWRMSTGYDRYGYDQDGYNRDGYDRNGWNRDGFSRDGFDRDGYTTEGFNHRGRDREGFNRDGFDQHGFNREGLDRWGLGKFRFDLDGFDSDGYGRDGYSRDGFDRDGRNRQGYDRNGIDADGKSMFRFDALRYDADGYNSDGTDYDGYTRRDNEVANRPARPRSDQHPRYAEWLAWYERTNR